MRLYILRHGIAEDADLRMKDSERRLTDEGRRKLQKVLTRAKAAGMQPDTILTSPYLRAAETAAVAKEILGFEGKIIETGTLTPDSNALRAWDEVRRYPESGQMLLVGHNPMFSDLAGYLIGLHGAGVAMKKGAVACVDLSLRSAEPQGTLLWLLTPKLAGA